MGMSCILIFILLLLSPFCKSEDQLTPANPLTNGDILVSKGGHFALGFFSPTSSNRTLYLGIWYHNIPVRTVVWVANRDNPITTPSSATLAITNSSEMVLSNSKGHTIWKTANNITSGGAGIYALLLDSGNLVLRLPNATDMWQSIDHPTDTILPTVRALVSYKDQVAGRLIAWKGQDDPSSGDFYCSGDPSSPTLQISIWNGTKPYCRLNIFIGVTVYGGIYRRNTTSVIYQTFVTAGDEFYFTYTVSDGSPYTRITLDYTGTLRVLSWNNNSSSWVVDNETPAAGTCDLYDACGPFSYCDYTGPVSTCQCLDGFEPNGHNSSRGCRRKEVLKCGEENHFIALPGILVPDKFLHIKNRSFDECAAECSNNCSCIAYAYANLSSAGAMTDPSRCLVWTGKLVDTGKLNNYGENLYLRLTDSPVQNNSSLDSKGKKNSNLVKIVLPTVACMLIFICIAVLGICKYRAGRRLKKEIQNRSRLGYLGSSNKIGENVEFPYVSFEVIATATDNFSDSNQIGRGGFGKVYKGMLEDGKEVAIKRLIKGSGQGTEEFKNEIVLIAKLQHRNLVRLLGCCIHGDERLLIYEYLPNKSLDAFLFDATKQYVLDWPTRFKIIKGVARGILYLHQDSRLTIIHRDLKVSNILLDAEMNPKISDFGMARIFGGNQNQANTIRVVGTYGYMSPEYAMGGDFSVKSDTYSFGVLLFEIVSGLKISSSQLPTNFCSLIAYAWRLWEDGKAAELLDSSVVESCILQEVLRCIHVGLLCVQDSPIDRPLMSSVMFMLENESARLAAPKQPVFFPLRNSDTEETGENTNNSINAMSITAIEGR